MPKHAYRSLQGLVIVITGAARGIGFATASACHAAGAQVAIGDVDVPALAASAARLPGALWDQLDVTDEASFQAFLARVERELGPIDVLVSNAGVMPLGRFTDESIQTAERQLAINVMGPLLGTKLVLPGMLERGRGHLVSVASVAGRTPCPGGVTYSATKAAVIAFMDSLRTELAGTPITTTTILPSVTATELTSGMKASTLMPAVAPEAIADAIVGSILRPQAEIIRPRAVRVALRSQSLLGRRFRDTMNRAVGANDFMLEIDDAARHGYEARARAAGATELLPAGDDQCAAAVEACDERPIAPVR